MADYRACPEAWGQIERYAKSDMQDDYAACLLEVRDRIAGLEGNAKPTPNDLQVGSSLVKRVRSVMQQADWMSNGLDEDVCGDDDPGFRYTSAAIEMGCDVESEQARAAIREVAAWLSERAGGTRACWLLEREAER